MGSRRKFSRNDLDLIEAGIQAQARRSFWAYRQYMRPGLIKGWWQREVARELTAFYEALIACERPKLLIQAPPQHGKSVQVVDFISWLAGKDPDLKVIYASFSERLGVRANLMLQRAYDSAKFQRTFPETRISTRNAVTISGQTQRNREIIEYVGREGFFRNTTVRGPITGEGLDLGVIDDPIKGREEASSQTIRDKTYDWLTDDFMTRFSARAGVLGIMTRWHLDDPFGRLIAADPTVRVLRYPAIAETDEPFRKAGDALFPEHKPLDFLLERKTAMHSANWDALYQQSPKQIGGGLFKDEWWRYYRALPPFQWRAIYADTAQKTKEANDYSVFQCWGFTADRQGFLIDQIRGKWEAPELLARARAFWAKHKAVGTGVIRAVKVEDKVSGTGLIQTLRREGMPMIPIERTTDKVTRALDAAPMIQAGNVHLPETAPWLSDYLAELSAFPNGAHDDQVDPTIDAIADIHRGGVDYSALTKM